MTAFEKRILDHGYLRVIEVWGTEERIIESARMSTGKGFLGWGARHEQACTYSPGGPWFKEHVDRGLCACEPKPGDEKLLRFLWEHKHATPFEMAGMVIEVQAPILVYRQWHRHRTWGYNEHSARYSPLPNLNYVPTVERLMMRNTANKQAGGVKGAAELTVETAMEYQDRLGAMWDAQEEFYQWSLQIGVPKELARTHIGVGRYSKMRATANLRNIFAFLALRMPENAQWEERQYANALAEAVQIHFPRTWALFDEGRPR